MSTSRIVWFAAHAARRAKVVQFMRDNPEMTLKEVGAFHDLTLERIRQIAKREDYKHPRHYGRGGKPPAVPKHCVVCGAITIRGSHGHWLLYCTTHTGWTRTKGMLVPPVPLTTHICATCGLTFARKEARRRPGSKPNPLRKHPQTEWFCDPVCVGVWAAEHHGFGYQPKPIFVCQQCGARRALHGDGARGRGVFCDVLCQTAWMAANGSMKAHGKFTPVIVGYDDLRIPPKGAPA